MDWKHELKRLRPLEDALALIPVGWGTEGKSPMFYGQKHPETPENWTKQRLSVDELLAWPRTPWRSVGARTGMFAGPLMVFDFDGASAVEYGCEHGLEPWAAITWHVHRDNDPNRFKVLFQPTLDQIGRIPPQPDGATEFQGKTNTADKTDSGKGEALEVFAGGRQAIVIGEHPSSGGNYIPVGLGPEELTAPPEAWLDHAIAAAMATQQRALSGIAPTRRQLQAIKSLFDLRKT